MFCEHCKKPIKHEISEETKKEIFKLSAKGYSCRDIETLLREKKMKVSFSTVSRVLRGKIPKLGSVGENDLS